MNYDNLLIKIFFISEYTINSARVHKINIGLYPNIHSYLLKRYNDSDSINETLKRIKFGYDVRPVCPVCGGKVDFIGRKRGIFGKYCSIQCRGANPETQIKAKFTYKKRTGYDHNTHNPESRGRYEDTCLKKYGVKNSFHSPKSKETCIERYGSEHWSNSEIGKSSLSKIMSQPEVIQKIESSKKHNKSFTKSKMEDKYYEYLLTVFPDVIRQYKCDRYPFNCDFYIPGKDLFIEFQGHTSHNTHPYNPDNIEDIRKVEEWYNKGLFDHIHTWTIRDVNKRNIAKKNNLNYIEVWSLKQKIDI